MHGGPLPVDSVGDRWLTQAALLRYLGIGKRTLRARQDAGTFKPHGRDPHSGKPLWKQSMIDSELMAAKNDTRILRDIVFPRNEKYIQNLQHHADQH